jgi:hypothetical protein
MCPPETAAQRFIARHRHPGHADNLRSPDRVLQWMKDYATHLPLDMGKQIDVDTSRNSKADEAVKQIQGLLSR